MKSGIDHKNAGHNHVILKLFHFYGTTAFEHILSLTMVSEKARFEQEVAQVEQWWKVIYLLSIISFYF